MSFKLMAHQKKSIAFLKKNPLVFDMSDAGTGKTLVEIIDFSTRRKLIPGCALVVATKSLLEPAWEADIQKFSPHLKVSIACAENRTSAFEVPADIYITNHDAANWLAKQPRKFFTKFNTLIADESSAFKHHTSMRSKALAKIAPHFTYRRLMSATPNSNGICDLWHQMFILDGGQRLGKSFNAFRSAVCTPVQVGPASNMIRWDDKEHAEDLVGALIKDVVIRHKFEECVDIPPNHQYAVSYNLPKRQMEAYKELEEESLLELKNSTISAINGAVLYGKMLQLASGAVYNDEGGYSVIDTGQYELIMDLVEERKHSIVFFTWVHQRDELIKIARKRKVVFTVYDGTTPSKCRTSIVKDYQAGKYQVLFAHPQSAGHGLTLTTGTSTIWASPTYNLEHFLQGLKRIHRIGQTQKTETIVIVAKDTVDEKVWDALQGKNTKLLKLLENLQ